MSKVLYSAAMSLDGFIAGAGGDMSWLNDHPGKNPIVAELIEKTGSLLIGARTQFGDDPNRDTPNEGPFGGAWHGQQFVLTHNPPSAPVPDTTFCDNLETAVALAKAAAGDKYVNVLGANVAKQCLAAGLLDEIAVTIVPALLGDGVRLYEHLGGTNIKLEHVSRGLAPNGTNIWLRVA
ncbi:dihydrofolate reductase family protein [Amycolatopsis sp. NPDC059657]|uniref:dihydrofolate reductase family protein n=1 Tax=Amycolatopsis sp. NPDC059657 TaxID=3346899 RepID=UPI0036720499